jgi:hypothetical protein
VLDPYSAFESDLLRAAPQVVNRLDRAFASELHRCVQRAARKSPDKGSDRNSAVRAQPCEGPVLIQPSEREIEARSLETTRPSAAEAIAPLLVVEDDDYPAAAVVPSRQFRQLFSKLELAARSSAR